MSAQTIAIGTDLLADDRSYAALNQETLRKARCFSVNLMSSPGAGKTSLLTQMLHRLKGTPSLVVEGDQALDLDAQRILETGTSVVQINTGQGCHLDAKMLSKALSRQAAPNGGYLFVENVGNAICPAAFPLGTEISVGLVSVTEGEEKPLKYSGLFSTIDIAVVTKIDLIPYLDHDLDQLAHNLRRVQPNVEIYLTSARSQEGMDAWLSALAQRRRKFEEACYE